MLLRHIGLDHSHPVGVIIDHVVIGAEIVNLEAVVATAHKDTGILPVYGDLHKTLRQQCGGSHTFVNGTGFSGRQQGHIILCGHIGDSEAEGLGEKVAIKALGFHHCLIIAEDIRLHLSRQIREERIGGNRILHGIQHVLQVQLRAEHLHKGMLVFLADSIFHRLDLTGHQHDANGIYIRIPFRTHVGGQL